MAQVPARVSTGAAPPCLPGEAGLADFQAWVRDARPGERVTYHEGWLVVDREGNSLVSLIAHAAHCLAGQGLLRLTQQRLGPERFRYIAERVG